MAICLMCGENIDLEEQSCDKCRARFTLQEIEYFGLKELTQEEFEWRIKIIKNQKEAIEILKANYRRVSEEKANVAKENERLKKQVEIYCDM